MGTIAFAPFTMRVMQGSSPAYAPGVCPAGNGDSRYSVTSSSSAIGRALGWAALRRLRQPLARTVEQAQALTERRFVTVSEPNVPELRQLVRDALARMDEPPRQHVELLHAALERALSEPPRRTQA